MNTHVVEGTTEVAHIISPCRSLDDASHKKLTTNHQKIRFGGIELTNTAITDAYGPILAGRLPLVLDADDGWISAGPRYETWPWLDRS